MLNELYTFAEPVQVVPFSSLKWGKFTLLHTPILLIVKIGQFQPLLKPKLETFNHTSNIF